MTRPMLTAARQHTAKKRSVSTNENEATLTTGTMGWKAEDDMRDGARARAGRPHTAKAKYCVRALCVCVLGVCWVWCRKEAASMGVEVSTDRHNWSREGPLGSRDMSGNESHSKRQQPASARKSSSKKVTSFFCSPAAASPSSSVALECTWDKALASPRAVFFPPTLTPLFFV